MPPKKHEIPSIKSLNIKTTPDTTATNPIIPYINFVYCDQFNI